MALVNLGYFVWIFSGYTKAAKMRYVSQKKCVLLAGEFVQPTSPSDSGDGPEHNGSTPALPVPSKPGPLLRLNLIPAGSRAQPAEDRR